MYSLQELGKAYTPIHVVGNGRVCAYGNGVAVEQLFGPHYSAAVFCSLLPAGGAAQAETRRLPQTAVYEHRLYDAHGRQAATIRDFAAAEHTAFVRLIDGSVPTGWTAQTRVPTGWKPLAPVHLTGARAFWGEIPEGASFYDYATEPGRVRSYITPTPSLMCLLVTGEADIQNDGALLHLRIGSGMLAAVFAADFGGLMAECRQVLDTGAPALLEAALADGRRFSARRSANRPLADPGLEAVADDVAMLIRCQQSASGGIMAGPRYHLSYVRDNYGTHRGLLSLGCFDEARRLLGFYADTFARYGAVHTAQVTDCYGFHIHEQDAVEITAYLMLMAAEYRQKTGDTDTFAALLPLIRWAAAQQHALLKNGMLPFNGDETYIACGLLPRTVINNGSMEATALYHRACDRLLAMGEDAGLTAAQRSMLAADRDDIERLFADNFVCSGTLTANCPGYYAPGEAPAYRHGVYQCGHGMGGNACRNPDGIYVCPDCAGKSIPGLQENTERRFTVPSAVLMPAVAGSPLMRRSYAVKTVQTMLDHFRAGGTLNGSRRMIGYEYGELLFALQAAGCGTPADIAAIGRQMLAVRDAAGAWVECYDNGQPVGCMCRPWESGINAAALLDIAGTAAFPAE